jgi:hypothetical protein
MRLARTIELQSTTPSYPKAPRGVTPGARSDPKHRHGVRGLCLLHLRRGRPRRWCHRGPAWGAHQGYRLRRRAAILRGARRHQWAPHDHQPRRRGPHPRSVQARHPHPLLFFVTSASTFTSLVSFEKLKFALMRVPWVFQEFTAC